MNYGKNINKMSLDIKQISRENRNHYYHKWLYYYGGASDVVTLDEFIDKYNPDHYGDINIYSTNVCPCIMCLEENTNE